MEIGPLVVKNDGFDPVSTYYLLKSYSCSFSFNSPYVSNVAGSIDASRCPASAYVLYSTRFGPFVVENDGFDPVSTSYPLQPYCCLFSLNSLCVFDVAGSIDAYRRPAWALVLCWTKFGPLIVENGSFDRVSTPLAPLHVFSFVLTQFFVRLRCCELNRRGKISRIFRCPLFDVVWLTRR